jgi:thermitase
MEFASIKPFGPGFRLLELSAPIADADERQRSVERLASAADVEYATQVYRGRGGLAEFPKPVIFVRFHPEVSPETQRETLGQVPGLRIEEERYASLDRVWKLASSAKTGSAVLNQVQRLFTMQNVEWAEPDWTWEVTLNQVIPNDPDFEDSWGLHNTGQTGGVSDMDMNAPEAWEITSGDPAVIVMILDAGIDLSHPDLTVSFAADFTGSGTGGGPTSPCAGHGTAVAGCTAALMNNGLMSTGVAPGVRLASASIAVDEDCDDKYVTSASWYVDALIWGIGIGARVASFQAGPNADTWSSLLALTIDLARLEGMVLFAASGNDPIGTIGFGHPGYHRSVNAVGGISSDGSSFGTTGNALFMVGPAAGIYTTTLGGGSDFASGTSLSSPFAAGVAGLVLSSHWGLSPPAVEMAMITGAKDLGATGFDSTFGHGLLRADKAIVLGGDLLPGFSVVDGSSGPGIPFDIPVYATVAAGVNSVPDDGAVLVRSGASYNEALVINKPLVMKPWGGNAVVIGK